MERRAEGDLVCQHAFMAQAPVRLTRPINVLDDNILLVPDRRDMRMREIEQTLLAKDRFRQVHDHVTRRAPRQEDAGLRATLPINVTIQEPLANLAATWIRQNTNFAVLQLRRNSIR